MNRCTEGEKVKPGPGGNIVRILLVERMNLLRDALAALLSDEDDLDVPAAIASIDEMVHFAHTMEPDVVIVDVEQLAGYGLAEVQELTRVLPGCPVLVLAEPDSASVVRAAFDSHVHGFVRKDVVRSHLADSVRRVAMGERVIDPTLAVAMLRAPRNPLTNRERQILEFVARGAPSAEIADRLYLAKGTVANYVSTIIRKIGARNRLEAVRIAADSGWLSASGGHADPVPTESGRDRGGPRTTDPDRSRGQVRIQPVDAPAARGGSIRSPASAQGRDQPAARRMPHRPAERPEPGRTNRGSAT